MTSASAPLLLLVMVTPLIVLGVLLVRLGRVGVPVDDAHARLLSAQRSLTLARILAVIGGVVAFEVAWDSHRTTLAVLAGCLAGLAGVAALVMGELAIRRMATGPAAGLEHRRVADYLPRWQALVTGVLMLIVPLSCAVGYRLQGRDGASLPYSCTTAQGETWGETNVWLGSHYFLPGLVVWLLALAVAAWGLGLVVTRPRDGSDPDLVRADDELRRWSATGLVAGAGLASGGLGASLLLSYAMGLRSADDPTCLTGSYHLGWQLALAALVLTVLLSLWCLVRVLAPHRSPLVGRPRTLLG